MFSSFRILELISNSITLLFIVDSIRTAEISQRLSGGATTCTQYAKSRLPTAMAVQADSCSDLSCQVCPTTERLAAMCVTQAAVFAQCYDTLFLAHYLPLDKSTVIMYHGYPIHLPSEAPGLFTLHHYGTTI